MSPYRAASEIIFTPRPSRSEWASVIVWEGHFHHDVELEHDAKTKPRMRVIKSFVAKDTKIVEIRVIEIDVGPDAMGAPVWMKLPPHLFQQALLTLAHAFPGSQETP